jgi:Kef-type K+ transport system membrane component KefB
MSPTLALLLLLGIIVFSAKAAGLASTRLGQPAVLGELLAGLVLGPTVINVLGYPDFANAHVGETIVQLGELGVIFLMFVAGLEVELEEMWKSGRVAILAGVFGVAVPLILGMLTSIAFHHPLLNSLFIGLILTATSVSISAQTLLELGVLRSKEGLALLGAAVVDDVLVILILSIFLALTGEADAGAGSIGIVVFRMVLFLVVATGLGLFVIPHLANWVNDLPVSEGVMAFVIIVTLLYAWSAEVVGEIAAITGAFIAGIAFARSAVRHTVEEGMHTLTYAFFVPIFLISIGLNANARALSAEGLWFTAAIIVAAIVGKVIGGWFGARVTGFTSRESLRVGVGLISRGEVGLIVAAIGLSNGLIDQAIYSMMVVMVLATTLVTPFFLRMVFPKGEATRG